MAMTVKWYGKGLLACMKNDVDLETADLYFSLHTSTYAVDLDADDFFNDATNELTTATGYTAGGAQVGAQTLSYDAASDQVRLDIDDISWTFTASKTWRYGVLYNKRGGASSADELIALVNWGTDQTVSTAYSLVIDATGLLYLDTT